MQVITYSHKTGFGMAEIDQDWPSDEDFSTWRDRLGFGGFEHGETITPECEELRIFCGERGWAVDNGWHAMAEIHFADGSWYFVLLKGEVDVLDLRIRLAPTLLNMRVGENLSDLVRIASMLFKLSHGVWPEGHLCPSCSPQWEIDRQKRLRAEAARQAQEQSASASKV